MPYFSHPRSRRGREGGNNMEYNFKNVYSLPFLFVFHSVP